MLVGVDGGGRAKLARATPRGAVAAARVARLAGDCLAFHQRGAAQQEQVFQIPDAAQHAPRVVAVDANLLVLGDETIAGRLPWSVGHGYFAERNRAWSGLGRLIPHDFDRQPHPPPEQVGQIVHCGHDRRAAGRCHLDPPAVAEGDLVGRGLLAGPREPRQPRVFAGGQPIDEGVRLFLAGQQLPAAGAGLPRQQPGHHAGPLAHRPAVALQGFTDGDPGGAPRNIIPTSCLPS